jgi:hypothetical protein
VNERGSFIDGVAVRLGPVPENVGPDCGDQQDMAKHNDTDESTDKNGEQDAHRSTPSDVTIYLSVAALAAEAHDAEPCPAAAPSS